jgi:hypothetical protein
LAFAEPQDRATRERDPSGGSVFTLKRMAIAVRFCWNLAFVKYGRTLAVSAVRFRENQSDKLREFEGSALMNLFFIFSK